MFELNSSEKQNKKWIDVWIEFCKNRTNEPIFELNFAEKLRLSLNIDKNYAKISEISYIL